MVDSRDLPPPADERRPPSASSTGEGVPWKAVALPVEHGGWGLLGEPIALGLVVAPSPAGACLALAALFAFLVRHPLRLVLMDVRKGVRYPRTRLALRFVATFALLATLFLAAAAALTTAPFWLALVAVAPFALAALGYDAAQRGRDVRAEAAGAIALSGFAAAIVLAGGGLAPVAFGSSALLALRALTSVIYVRARIRLDRGMPAGPAAALGGHVAALAAAAWLAHAQAGPWLAVLAFVVLLGRAAHGLSRLRRPIRPHRLGFQELAFGLLTLALLAVGYRLGL